MQAVRGRSIALKRSLRRKIATHEIANELKSHEVNNRASAITIQWQLKLALHAIAKNERF